MRYSPSLLVSVYHRSRDIFDIINKLKTNPNDRRMLCIAYNPDQIEDMALPPCHTLFQFYVADGRLSLQLYQRSADIFLGVPFNIASYALLLMMMAQVTGLKAGDFVHTFGDAHIYLNHIEQVKLQLTRDTRALPKMLINPEVKDSGKGYEAFSTTLSFPEGISVPVQLSVKDMAGNGPVTKTINLKVDTKAPVVEIENPIAANTYTKDDTLSITPTVTDETSGIANIYVGTSSNVSSTNNIGSGTTSGTAISCDISSLIDGIYTIYVIAVDNAGNVSNPVSAGSITVDRTNPVVTVNAPLSESNIYKIYTLSGTVSESNLDTSKAPVLYIWGKLSAESENSWKKATDLYPSCVGITADDAFVNANGAWSINLDTTKINAASGSTTKVYAAIGLTDKAGNTSVPAAAPVTSY